MLVLPLLFVGDRLQRSLGARLAAIKRQALAARHTWTFGVDAHVFVSILERLLTLLVQLVLVAYQLDNLFDLESN